MFFKNQNFNFFFLYEIFVEYYGNFKNNDKNIFFKILYLVKNNPIIRIPATSHRFMMNDILGEDAKGFVILHV